MHVPTENITPAIKLFCFTGLLAYATSFQAFPVTFTGQYHFYSCREMFWTNTVTDISTPRSSRVTILMDGKTNAIRDRITSVKKTKKLTMAMKLVAASKVRNAQDAVFATRPFSDNLQSVFSGLVSRIGDNTANIPLLSEREVKKVTLCIITGDGGLCGSYNSFIIKKAEFRYKQLEDSGIDVDMILVGKKGISYFKRRGFSIRTTFLCGQKPSRKVALELSDELLNVYLSKETDVIELMYTKFTNLITSTPSVRTLLPCKVSEISQKGDEIFQFTSQSGKFKVGRTELEVADARDFPTNTIFEQDPTQIVNSILPLYLIGQIYRILQESIASELAARMQSMQSASDNAGDLVKSLSIQYNRARQASVTQELLEIVAGASALE